MTAESLRRAHELNVELCRENAALKEALEIALADTLVQATLQIRDLKQENRLLVQDRDNWRDEHAKAVTKRGNAA